MTENIFKSLFLCLLYLHVYMHTAIFRGLHKSLLPDYCHFSESNSDVYKRRTLSRQCHSWPSLAKSSSALSYSPTSVQLEKTMSNIISMIWSPRLPEFQVSWGQTWEMFSGPFSLFSDLSEHVEALPSLFPGHVIRILQSRIVPVWGGPPPRPVSPWDQCIITPVWSLEEREPKGHKCLKEHVRCCCFLTMKSKWLLL